MKTTHVFNTIQGLNQYLENNKDRTIVIIDSNVYRMWQHIILKNVKFVTLNTSEELKTLDTAKTLYNSLLVLGANRKTKLVGIGGGITTDIVGFVASTFMRGVEFEFVPTTLLAMVDAAIGGKNGVNFNGYKNMIGTFNMPKSIWYCYDFLRTLPNEERYSAFGEILKYGIGFSDTLYDILNEHSMNEILNNNLLLRNIIDICIDVKEGIIEYDPFEEKPDGRCLLNLGHTIGHAIEKLYSETKRCEVLKHHGYAVMFGLYYITRFIKDENYRKETVALLTKYINEIGFDFNHIVEIEEFEDNVYTPSIQYIKNDKKKISEYQVYCIIPTEKGKCQRELKVIEEL